MDNLKQFFLHKRVLITGHTGFKGAWLTQVLTNWGAEVTGIALEPHVSPNLFDTLALSERMAHYISDVRDFSAIQDIFAKEKPEIVIHLAAQAIVRESYRDPVRTVAVNTLGTTHILEAIRSTPSVKSAVFITTDKVYENKEWWYAYRENDQLGGHDLYSGSKSAADIIINCYARSFFHPEKFGKGHHTLIAAARAGNVIGGGDWSKDRLLPDFVRSVFEDNISLRVRNPHAIRPWEYVLEPISGYLLLAKKLYEGDVGSTGAWNFGPRDDSFVTAETMIRNAVSMCGRGAYHIESDDALHESTLLKLDIAKAKTALGWSPILNLERNLRVTLDWYRAYYEKKDMREVTDAQIDSFFEEFERRMA
ncbi:MAG: CDP-glucose 4,6-dehydratase [bacterium]|nr:CDP-glucose 4,6-dehydratase [bacterium]